MKKIPGEIPHEPEVSEPCHMIQGTNDFGTIGYGGPCPPRGQTHRYFFRVYGLDTPINLPAGANADQLKKAIEGHVVQYSETYANYGR